MNWEYLRDPYGEEWAHASILVREPFASRFRLDETRRYDLLAHMSKALQLPKDAGYATERFLHFLYLRVTEAHELGLLKLNDESVGTLIVGALWELDDATFEQLVEDLGWARQLRVHTDLADYRNDFRQAFARKFTRRCMPMLRTHRRAA